MERERTYVKLTIYTHLGRLLVYTIICSLYTNNLYLLLWITYDLYSLYLIRIIYSLLVQLMVDYWYANPIAGWLGAARVREYRSELQNGTKWLGTFEVCSGGCYGLSTIVILQFQYVSVLFIYLYLCIQYIYIYTHYTISYNI